MRPVLQLEVNQQFLKACYENKHPKTAGRTSVHQKFTEVLTGLRRALCSVSPTQSEESLESFFTFFACIDLFRFAMLI